MNGDRLFIAGSGRWRAGLCCGCAMARAGCSWPQGGGAGAPAAAKGQLLKKTFQDKATGGDRAYWVYLPAGYAPNGKERWPLMLFLHGMGERGDDIDAVLKHGPIMEAGVKGRDLPFVILVPQLPLLPQEEARRAERARNRPAAEQTRTAPLRRPMARETRPWEEIAFPSGPLGWASYSEDLMALVDATMAEYRIDPRRVYLTGLSMGGFGSFWLAAEHPQRWAACAPICGGGDPDQVAKAAGVPMWIFHGGRDPVVPVEYSLKLANVLEEAGGEVRLTVHEDMKHDSWTRVYEGEDLYQWLLAHQRSEEQ